MNIKDIGVNGVFPGPSKSLVFNPVGCSPRLANNTSLIPEKPRLAGLIRQQKSAARTRRGEAEHETRREVWRMTTQQHSCRTRWVSALPSSRIERFCARPYDVAVGYARRRLHAAARMVPWLVASVTMRVAALCGTLMGVPAVVLDVERQKKCLWLRSAGRGHEKDVYQYARPSIRSLVGASPLANAPLNRTPRICRRDCSRRVSRGRSPPI